MTATPYVTTPEGSGLWGEASGPAVAVADAPTAEHLVFLHGFTQTRRSWDPVITAMTRRGHCCRSFDLPGHGRSAHVTAGLWKTADLVGAAIGPAIGPATVVGYSMGGRIALHLALQHPELVSRLVLIGATAGLDDEADRAARRRADDVLATRVVDIGVDAFLDEWLRGPLFASLPTRLAGVEQRRVNTAEGLAASLRTSGTGHQDPLWSRLAAIRCPTSLVVGGLDAKFRAINERMLAGLPDAQLHVIDGAGHACHLEAADRFTDVLVAAPPSHG